MAKVEGFMPHNPLTDDDLLEAYFSSSRQAARLPASAGRTRALAKKRREEEESEADEPHYKICCISLYREDIERLEEMVTRLKAGGHTRANKSRLIRYALSQVDIEAMPKQL